eukprot:scaffold2077_cov233-Chaetoceros_neogracile.AAC.5
MSTRDSQSIKFDEQQAKASNKLQATDTHTSNNQEQSSKIQDPRSKIQEPTNKTNGCIYYILARYSYFIYYST